MQRRRRTLEVPLAPEAPAGPLQERRVFDDLFTTVYEELRRLAASVRKYERTNTLTPTALVNEAWLKLCRSPQLARTTETHFKGIAAHAMRQVLVEAARRRNATKRGAGIQLELVPLGDAPESLMPLGNDLLALDLALRELAREQPRQAAVVEGRFFGGLSLPELSEWLDVSQATVQRDWRFARAWLSSQLSRRAGRDYPRV